VSLNGLALARRISSESTFSSLHLAPGASSTPVESGLENTLIEVWRQTLVENAMVIELGKERYTVRRISKHKLRRWISCSTEQRYTDLSRTHRRNRGGHNWRALARKLCISSAKAAMWRLWWMGKPLYRKDSVTMLTDVHHARRRGTDRGSDRHETLPLLALSKRLLNHFCATIPRISLIL
jgi:hypothetical protein